MELKYSAAKAMQAQLDYCDEKGYPCFLPSWNICPKCCRNIFGDGGYSVEVAGNTLITSCPFCNKSFDD